MSEKQEKDWKKIKEAHLESEENAIDEKDNIDFDDEDEGGQGQSKPSLDHPSYQSLEEKLTVAEQKAHDNWEKLVRSVAEVDNIRRRAERDVANAHRFALEKFINQLIPVLDSLEQAIGLASQGEAGLHEGLLLTQKLFLDLLNKEGISIINPEGESFNPQFHEAMSMQEAPGVAPGTVLVVFQKGYTLNDRVIRPARVIVSK